MTTSCRSLLVAALNLKSERILLLPLSIATGTTYQELHADETKEKANPGRKGLSKADVNCLLELVEDLRVRGKAILYISHRRSEIMRLADDITMLWNSKSGRVAREQFHLHTGKGEGAAAPHAHPAVQPFSIAC